MNDLFKRLVFDMIVKAAIKRLFIMVPALGWGPVGIVVSYLISKFADMAYDETKEYIELNMIKFKNEKHQRAFDKEFIKLKMLEGSRNAEDIEKAIQEAQHRLADLVMHHRV